MSSRIRVLSEQTINQIAAGEVIENPASVVKELVENSIDAGSNLIQIETKGGGLQFVKVIDNGSGMTADDALLCLERYATSKIYDARDLFHLNSMGFRGEALASIASISKVSLTTALAGAQGTCVEMEAGKILKVEQAARMAGTTIEVRSLFFNVPARRKFQKSSAICAAEITRTVSHLALAHPRVGFELVHQGRKIFSTQPEPDLNFGELLFLRARQILGEEFTASTFKMNLDGSPFEIQGFISAPTASRSNRTGQFLFINRRPVYCPLVSFAVKDGYGTRLETRRHPAFVIHLNIPQQFIDVNVHPQKKEVRILDENMFRNRIQEAVSSALQQNEGRVESGQPASSPFSFSAQNFSFLEERAPNSLFSDFLVLKEENMEINPELNLKQDAHPLGIFTQYLLIEAASVVHRISLPKPKDDVNGILIVDLCAASARLAFEALSASAPPFHKQALMLPITIDCSLSDAQVLECCLEDMEKIGIEMRKLSHNTFIIEAIPPFMKPDDIKLFIDHISEELNVFNSQKQLDSTRLRACAAFACRFANAHKKKFMLQESMMLFEQLLRTSSPYLCPMGKSTMVHLSNDEIKDYFSFSKKR